MRDDDDSVDFSESAASLVVTKPPRLFLLKAVLILE